ncbi:L,D-transpeptidase [Ensifer sp. ENS02]|nr:L,D-transpeptidase [Ensifer sp. ENS02]
MRILSVKLPAAPAVLALSVACLSSPVLADTPEPPRYEADQSAVFIEDDYIRFLFRQTQSPTLYPDSDGLQRSRQADASTAELIAYQSQERAGTIIVETSDHALFLILKDGRAIRYLVGVGRDGFAWRGVEAISKKAEWPAWVPTAQLRQHRPELPVHVAGGPDNPLGARALYLGDTLYRIHGTNEPETVGGNVSSGCIRMTNADIIDLYRRVAVGTKVIVR